MSLEIQARVEERDVEVELRVADGEHVAVLGPNGAGKSTLLGLLTGVVQADAGRAAVDDRVLFDVDSTTWLPPYDRGIASLAQEALLFPHLTALDNVAFGPRSVGRGRGDSRDTARSWLDEVDAASLADRRPAQLSGGQAQRIAVARALAAEPRLLVLDEPMAALDVTVAPFLRQMLRRVLRDRTLIMVTHDILDAVVLADRIVVMEQGRIVEDGPVHEVLERPRSEFGARIVGVNFVRGPAMASGVRGPNDAVISGRPDVEAPLEGEMAAVFEPSAVAVHREAPSPEHGSVMSATVMELEPRGAHVRVRTEHFTADVPVADVADLELAPGTDVWLEIDPASVRLYPV